jgi:hypothetical protein
MQSAQEMELLIIITFLLLQDKLDFHFNAHMFVRKQVDAVPVPVRPQSFRP